MGVKITEQEELGRGPRGGYKWLGQPLTRVTSIIGLIDKPALKKWAATCACEYIGGVADEDRKKWLLEPQWQAGRAYEQHEIDTALGMAGDEYASVSKAAADYGTEAHKWIESHCKGENPAMPVSEKVLSSITGYLEWEADHKLETVKMEWMIADPLELVGGMLDRLVYVDGELSIVDYKTGKPAKKQYYPDGLYPEQKMQVDAYHHIAQPLCSEPITRRYVLLIPKDGQPSEMVEVTTNPDETWVGFVGLLRARQVLLNLGWKAW